jgi:probable HAF family extracellular repeat protein
MTDLGTLPGANYSDASAINDAGIIVGQSGTYGNASGNHAYMWQDGVMTDLNSLLPAHSGITLINATGINNAGQIVGYGTGGQFLLTLGTATITLPITAVAATASAPTSPVWVADTAVNIQAHIDGLQALAAANNLFSIDLTDSGSPKLTLTAAQYSADALALAHIVGPYDLMTTGVTAVAATGQIGFDGHVTSVAVADSAANIAADLAGLFGIALSQANYLASITLTDSGVPTLSINNIQLTLDRQIINKVTAPNGFILSIDATPANLTIYGIIGDVNVVNFSGNAAQYHVTAGRNGFIGVSDSSAGRSSTDTLSDIQQLKFADQRELAGFV